MGKCRIIGAWFGFTASAIGFRCGLFIISIIVLLHFEDTKDQARVQSWQGLHITHTIRDMPERAYGPATPRMTFLY
jgi:hypothetical protein